MEFVPLIVDPFQKRLDVQKSEQEVTKFPHVYKCQNI